LRLPLIKGRFEAAICKFCYAATWSVYHRNPIGQFCIFDGVCALDEILQRTGVHRVLQIELMLESMFCHLSVCSVGVKI
jgi:hypothetical protein